MTFLFANVVLRQWMSVSFCAYLFDSDQNLSMHYNDAWKCKTLTWRKRGNLSDRNVHNINSVNDKISNSTEEKTRLLCRSQTGWRYYREPRGNPPAAIFIFNFTMADFAMANELELMAAYIIWEMVVISVSWKNSRKATGRVDRTPTHKTHLCSTVCSQARNAHHALGSSHTDCSVIFVRLKRVESSGVAHVSPVVALSLAVHLEHIIFLIHSSFYHDTRTRSTNGATRSPPRIPSSSCESPSSPSRHAAPSRITLAWKPAK